MFQIFSKCAIKIQKHTQIGMKCNMERIYLLNTEEMQIFSITAIFRRITDLKKSMFNLCYWHFILCRNADFSTM